MRMTLREFIWREMHTDRDGTYDGVRRSFASRQCIARAFPIDYDGIYDPLTGTFKRLTPRKVNDHESI